MVPGIRFSLGLKGGSVSFGTRGLRYTVGTSGHRITAGIPGTGLSWTQKLKSPLRAGRPRQPIKNQLPSAASAQTTQPQQPRTFTPPTGAGVQFPQTRSPAVLGGQSPQLRQPHQATSPLNPSIASTQKPMPPTGYSVAADHAYHLVVPAWLVWAVLTVIGIGSLCFLSALVGSLVR